MKNFAVRLLAVATSLYATAWAQEPSKRDQIHIAVQEICPISGERLGEHGSPIKAKIGEENLYLCCKECLKGKVNTKHWAKIHANFAKAQGICPVMRKELPTKAKWTIVKGQIVYVCCPPCTKKIAADPDTFLQLVDELYDESIQDRVEEETE
ncbi:MAG: hypothetical protein U0795_23285 [Pirellulales bacterium]